MTEEQRNFLRKAFGVTNPMVSYALTYHPKWGNSETAKRIRSLALQRGGFLMVCAPASEVVHDAEGKMRQHFENGWMWEADKATGTLEVKNQDGETVQRVERAGVTDIKAVQDAMGAMCAAKEA